MFHFDVFILKVLESEKRKPVYSLKGENEEGEFEERKENDKMESRLDWRQGKIFFPSFVQSKREAMELTKDNRITLDKCEDLNKFLIEPINTVILFCFSRGIEAKEINILVHLVS